MQHHDHAETASRFKRAIDPISESGGRPLRRLIRLTRRFAETVLIERRYRLPLSLEMRPRDHAQRLAPGRNAYAPSPWRLLRHLLADQVAEDDVFVDFGCGKGRVLLEAAELYPFRAVVGVEVEPDLADTARVLLSENQARLRAKRWDVVTADVLDYQIPDDLTVAYLFDPFTGAVFDELMSRLELSVDRAPRRVRIVYLTPVERSRLESNRRVRPIRAGNAGWIRAGGRYKFYIADLLPRAHGY